MNKNQLENTVLSLLFVAGLIIVAMFTKSGAYNFVANIFATDIYIRAALLLLAIIIGYSLIFEEERSVIAGIAMLVFLLFTGSIILPEISKETALSLLKIVVVMTVIATAIFLFSLTIKENKNESSSKNFAKTKPPNITAI